MISNPLDDDERLTLLKLARQSIERAVNRQPPLQLILDKYSLRLQEIGASFVTLTEDGELRGCIGALEAYQPLVQDVCEHAAAAALEDYRFPPVQPEEVSRLCIEISRLTTPQPLTYGSPSQLPTLLRPKIDGVILRDGFRRATFLPQVWEKLPDPEEFLGHLCQKMGASPDLWQRRKLEILTYQVEEFHESA